MPKRDTHSLSRRGCTSLRESSACSSHTKLCVLVIVSYLTQNYCCHWHRTGLPMASSSLTGSVPGTGWLVNAFFGAVKASFFFSSLLTFSDRSSFQSSSVKILASSEYLDMYFYSSPRFLGMTLRPFMCGKPMSVGSQLPLPEMVRDDPERVIWHFGELRITPASRIVSAQRATVQDALATRRNRAQRPVYRAKRNHPNLETRTLSVRLQKQYAAFFSLKLGMLGRRGPMGETKDAYRLVRERNLPLGSNQI